MNSFTNTILTLMLGWLRALLNAVLDFISSDRSTAFFDFFRNNWRILFLVLCVSGFILDKVVYLIRWRPRPLWLRRRAKRARRSPQPLETYDEYDIDEDAPALPTGEYAPVPDYGYADDAYPETAPTVQYQMQPQQRGGQAFDLPPADLPYATPYFAPEAAQNANRGGEAPLRWDEESQGHTFAPAADQQHRFAFGMAPSFGSAQSEPKYNYHDAAPTFAPPQYGPDYDPAETFAPLSDYEQFADEQSAEPPQAYPAPSPGFRPFSDRGEETFAPSKNSRFGAVAKKARSLLNADDAYENLTYQDLQPTVDVSKAFHSPVYPEKKPEGDA